MDFRKYSPATHPQSALMEAAGLRWLKETQAAGGTQVVDVVSAEPGLLVLEEIPAAAPTRDAAAALGDSLARMHRSLPDGTRFGTLPPDHPAQQPLFGPADQPLEVGEGLHDSWGVFHAEERLNPILEPLRAEISDADGDVLGRARDRIASGAFDDQETPSRIHGDLWSGNVLWGKSSSGRRGDVEAVLIDPAAHAGHREGDIALLHLFGLPHLDAMMDTYQQQAPLAEGWEDRIPVHQFFYLAAHWLLFGEGYAQGTLSSARRILAL